MLANVMFSYETIVNFHFHYLSIITATLNNFKYFMFKYVYIFIEFKMGYLSMFLDVHAN